MKNIENSLRYALKPSKLQIFVHPLSGRGHVTAPQGSQGLEIFKSQPIEFQQHAYNLPIFLTKNLATGRCYTPLKMPLTVKSTLSFSQLSKGIRYGFLQRQKVWPVEIFATFGVFQSFAKVFTSKILVHRSFVKVYTRKIFEIFSISKIHNHTFF